VERPRPTFLNYWQNEVGAWLGWVDTDVFSTEGGNYTLNAPLNFSNQGLGIGAGAELTIASDGFFFLNGPGAVTATGDLTFQSGSFIQMNSGSEIRGEIVLTGGGTTLNVQCTTLFQDDVEYDAGVNRGNRLRIVSTNADQTINAANTDFVEVPAGVFGAPRKCILLNGTVIGQTLHVYSYDTGNAFSLVKQDTTTAITDFAGNNVDVIATTPLNGDAPSHTVIWNGTTWRWCGY
jgi:hypothetical protein